MTQKILGISGRKQSGKNTTANFLIGLTMNGIGLIHGKFRITKKGQLHITDLWGDTDYEGIFDVQRNTPTMRDFCAERLDPYIKLYSFADLLKQGVCMDVLGLQYEQCYGTDDEKNEPTHLKWEDMPGMITNKKLFDAIYERCLGPEMEEDLQDIGFKMHYHEPGHMSGREVMQYVGTDIFRKMYSDVWADATVRRIQQDQSEMAIICDLRFPNEVMAIKNAGGKVMRLTRNPFGDQDAHESETALDKENFDWDQFDWIIDNASDTVEGQCELTYKALQPIEWCPSIYELTQEEYEKTL